jgi:hypothetical protein
MNAKTLAATLALALVVGATAMVTPGNVAFTSPVPPTTPALGAAQLCDQLRSTAPAGLYVVSVTPVPALVWDRTPRQFIVDLCSTLPRATPIGSQFVVFIYFPGEAHPRGQTSELPVRLEPGLHEMTFQWWTPGLQNHISACNIQPPVQVAVAYTFPPSANFFHPIPYADGKDRLTFAVKCGGHFR